MQWISVVFLLLIHYGCINCAPTLPPCYQELREAVRKSEINSPQGGLVSKTDLFQIGDPRTFDSDEESPCKRAVTLNRNKSVPSSIKKPTATDSDLWDSYIGSSQHLQEDPSGCGDTESGRDAVQRHNEEKHRMFEGLLKLTTILNRIDSFFTNKAKGLINGLHKMMQSEEDEQG